MKLSIKMLTIATAIAFFAANDLAATNYVCRYYLNPNHMMTSFDSEFQLDAFAERFGKNVTFTKKPTLADCDSTYLKIANEPDPNFPHPVYHSVREYIRSGYHLGIYEQSGKKWKRLLTQTVK